MRIFPVKYIIGCLILLLSLYYGFISMADIKKIDSVESIKLGSQTQWIYITGNNTDNPILLVIHGGPGFAMLPLFHYNNKKLENKFTIINWDQRGAGRSYDPKLKKLTLEQLVSDAHDLTTLLKSRFKQNKIFILGHSTGSIIAVLLVKRYPEDYYAYVGVGQVVNFAETEQLSYAFAYEEALRTNNKKAIKELQKIGEPNEKGNYRSEYGYDVTEKWVEYFGGELHNHKSLDSVYDEIFESSIYEHAHQQLLKGYEFSQILFDYGMRDFDAEKEASTIDVPVYLFSGKYDHDTTTVLTKRYFDILKAPIKNFIIFPHSAHFPFYEEPKLFNKEMLELVLPNAFMDEKIK